LCAIRLTHRACSANRLTVGRKNRNCLCETCEKNGRGGYAPDRYSSDDLDNDQSDSEESEADKDKAKDTANLTVNLNERRTRRGVYAIVQEEEDDSEESEDDESNLPLANVQVPADEEIELEAPTYNGREYNSRSTSRKSSTDHRGDGEDTFTSARSTRASSRNRLGSAKLSTESGASRQAVSSSAEARGKAEAKCFTNSKPNDKSEAKQSKREDSPPPRRITRSLSALSPTKDDEGGSTRASPSNSQMQRKESSESDAVNQSARSPAERLRRKFAKSPPSEEAPSLPDASSAQTTRHNSSERMNGNAEDKKQKSSRLSTPSKSKSKEKAQEDHEARVLRARSSLSGNHTGNNHQPSKPVVPRGPDGKPLPTCSTCSNVLPVISVDSKIIWGLDTTPKKGKKKKEKRDCPRSVFNISLS
jgi:histone-lysine N-methyltransferase SUV420H